MKDLTKQIEAILYASGKGVSETQLATYCEEKPRAIKKALQELQEAYEAFDSSLTIGQYQDRWKLTVRSKYSPYIQKIVSETEFSPALLKTLAVIAYKSPVLQADVISMRGQSGYDHIKVLVKEKFVTKEDAGRSYLLKITEKFYNYFDVEGDEEIREVFAALKTQQERLQAIEEELRESQQKLGDLEVVDAEEKEHEELFETEKQEPIRKEKSPEEKEVEQNFLSDIDKRIEELSARVGEQQLPERKKEEEQEKEEEYL